MTILFYIIEIGTS